MARCKQKQFARINILSVFDDMSDITWNKGIISIIWMSNRSWSKEYGRMNIRYSLIVPLKQTIEFFCDMFLLVNFSILFITL